MALGELYLFFLKFFFAIISSFVEHDFKKVFQ